MPKRAYLRGVPPVVAAVTIAVALGAGLLPVLLPLGVTLAIASLGLLVVAAGLVWRTLRVGDQGPLMVAPADFASPPAEPQTVSLTAGRWLFFLGCLTVSQSSWRLPAGLTVSEIFFILAFVCCLVAVLRGRPVEVVPGALVFGVTLFALGGAVSAFGAVAPNQAAVEVVHTVYVMLLWAWTGAMVLRTRHDFVIALALWGGSSLLNAVGALAQVAGVNSIAGSLVSHRATAFTEHPNDLGAAAAVPLIPLAMLAANVRRGAGLRLALWIVVVLVAVSMVLSGSVASMAGAALGGLLWLSSPAVNTGVRFAVLVGVLAAILGVSILGNKTTSPVQRLSQVVATPGSTPDAGSARIRLKVIDTIWPRIRSNPFVGTGLGDSNLAVPVIAAGVNQIEQVHGAPLAAWYETGILGVIGLMLVFGVVFMQGWRATVACADHRDRALGWSLVASFTAFTVYAMTAPLFFEQYGWLSATLIIGWAARTARAPTLGMPAMRALAPT